jgi:hypothetical protein
MRVCVRKSAQVITVSLTFAASALVAQQPNSAIATGKGFLPAGPFQFEPGGIQPTYMDALDERPVAKSPDGKLDITVSGPKNPDEAWVTISLSTFPAAAVQVWPIQASVAVLWRPDSGAFALTDNRYANGSYVLVCGTEFRMGDDERGLGIPITDLTPIVRKAYEERPRKYYKTDEYETLMFYAKVLRWIGNDELLIGISARTAGPPTFPDRGMNEWDFAYLVDVPDRKVVREVNKVQLLSEYKIKAPY